MMIAYRYDGTFAGFLTCAWDALEGRIEPAAFLLPDGGAALWETRELPADRDRAQRLYGALRKRVSPAFQKMIARGFLTCLPEKELHLFRLTAKLLREGPGFLRNRSDGTLYPVIRAVQHLNGEVHLLKGFVRFSDLGGVLGGEIEPKNRVLPVLGGHFAARFHNERFFLYDRTHKEALFHVPGQSIIRPLADFQMAPPDEAEARCRLLWKRFYDTIAIKERENPRLRMSNMPKRYWKTMTEFQGEAYFQPDSSTAGFPSPSLQPTLPPDLGAR